MEWQDAVFAVGGFILAATVLPTLLSNENKPAWPTSLSLAVILGVYTALFATLDLELAAAGAALQSVLWGWVVLQTRRAHRAAVASEQNR
ncbi:MAG: hypothetical protein O7A71_02490 [Chloroflexi bacterium]|nr:hypothetical protein [Chloroflexota bacterium]